MDIDNKYGNCEIHKYLLSMLDDIDCFCRQNNIKYSLSGGTLLGAVRENGFIAWDDDADIMFDRKNYGKFIRAVKNELSDKYMLVGKTYVRRLSRKDNEQAENEKKCIDLFVFDPVPQNRVCAKLKVLVLKFLQGTLKEENNYSSFSFLYKTLLLITSLIGKLFSRYTKQKLYAKVSRWCDTDKYEYVNIYNTWFNQIGNLKFDRSVLKGYTDVNFEGRKFMSIIGYDGYLTELYGDYMKPPSKDKRKPIHR